MKLSQQILLLNFFLFRFINVAHLKSDCPAVDKCGNVTIPYPFSRVDDCKLDESYYIQCDPVTQIPRLNISRVFVLSTLGSQIIDTLQVLEIKLDGRLIVALPAGYGCWDKYGNLTSFSLVSVNTFRFPFSYTQNKFVGVGCDIEADMSLEYTNTGCPTNCNHCNYMKNESCHGSRFCVASIPQGMTNAAFTANNHIKHSKISDYSKCGHAFIVEYTKYNFSVGDLSTVRHDIFFPVVLEWFAGNTYCEKAIKNNKTYMCRGKSRCEDRDRESGLPGYLCLCSDGYSGNPYVNNGCQDINECESSELNKCASGYKCKNIDGGYECICPKGLQADAKSGGVCTHSAYLSDIESVTKGKAMAGIFGIAGATIVMTLTYCGIKMTKTIKGREDFSKQNGGIMLQVLFARKDHVNNNAIIFTYEELKKATDNFNETNIIGQGGYGVVYRAILANKTTVAIKKSKSIDESQIKQFMNEVIILSQIDHPNIVKLLGCCLETHVPLLVYEYITNNTLCHHIHKEASMTFGTRLKIAAETAEALFYMNSTTQIIHRDVKPSNILLNDDFSAKVSDFGISRFVPSGQSHLSTYVKGTIGYVDPEYFCTGKLNEKSDVYSFGVVLVELLTGTKIHSLEISLNVYRGAAAYLSSLLERNALFKVLDKQLKSEEYADVVKGVAKLAINCLDLEGRNRPTMKEVKTELEKLRCVLSSTT